MAPLQANPSCITLRLKNHKSTTLVHADPLASFLDIRRELLIALHLTRPTGRLRNGVEIPNDPLDVLLARPRDVHDVSAGWVRLRTEDEASEEELDEEEQAAAAQDVSTTKKRGAATTGKGRSAVVRRPNCPKAAGLKDGGVLAYKFRSELGARATKRDVVMGGDDDEGEEWDVVIASYEDTTGTVNEGDVGAIGSLDEFAGASVARNDDDDDDDGGQDDLSHA